MFRSRRTKRRPPADAAPPRLGRSRRLAIEAMENRLMLSGNQIDYSIWNLDSIQSNYAVISQDGTLPAVNAGDSASDRDTALLDGQIDVSWVQVPGLYLNRQQASVLAQRHLQDAVDQGIVSSELKARLYDQWSVGFSYDATASRVPVFAIGFGPAGGGFTGGLGDYDFDSPGDVLSAPNPAGAPFLLHIGSGGIFGSTNSWFRDSGSLLGSDVVSSLSTDAFLIIRNQLSDSLSLQRQIGGEAKFDGPFLNRIDVSTNFQNTLDVALDVALDTPIVEVPLVDDAVQIASPGSLEPVVVDNWFAPATENVPIAAGEHFVVTQPSDRIAAIDLGSQIVATLTGNTTGATASDLDATIDQLLAEDSILAGTAGEAIVENAASGSVEELVAAGGESATGLAAEGEDAATPEVNLLAEGGMVPVESIVGAVSSGSLEGAPVGEQLAGAGEGSELVGDLARVAVMELIEGAAEPMAPALEGDHVAVLAAHDAAGSVQIAKIARNEIVREGSLVRTFAEQAGSAVALVMPVSPSYLAALVTSVSDVFAAVAFGESTVADAESSSDAREEAFADWDEADESLATSAEAGFSYLSTLPLVGALAIERLLAAKRRRQQAGDERNPKRRGNSLG